MSLHLRIEKHKAEREQLAKELEEFVKDKSIPLDKRWEIFIDSGLGKEDSYYHDPDGIDWNKHTLFDDFYCDKHQIMTVDSMLETAKEKAEEGEMEFDEIAFKEYFLDKFVKSFENDW